MQDSVAAIRASRSHARFVLPQAHRRERRLGLHRFYRTPAAGRTHALIDARQQPLEALRGAARGLIGTPARPNRSTYVALQRQPRMRWSHAEQPSRARRAAPWRG